ncbi:phosphate signaling complex protein PhoU [uncultured Tolumonas sp.]|uniref:phosphate signaling complex protein PhoU n=1 Tax=uncultured Tolumonas sp. TaxID=263765 RepID=UPI002A0A5C7B|nr:phosphate signaling complex protein PhoU [uncultured Tolumonas sp.]
MNLTNHVSVQFNSELTSIRNRLLAMGGVVEQQLHDALQVLRTQNIEQVRRIIETDRQVNMMEVEINEACTRVLALRHPAASDLRLIQIVIKTVSDLERIGNVARKIVRFVRKNVGLPHLQPLYIHKMGEQAKQMLRSVLDAFARMDVEAAVKLYKEDDKIDEQYELLIYELMNYMTEHPQAIPQVLEMIRCAHSIERIGDRCQNISDYIIYYIQGKDVRHTKIEHLTDLR